MFYSDFTTIRELEIGDYIRITAELVFRVSGTGLEHIRLVGPEDYRLNVRKDFVYACNVHGVGINTLMNRIANVATCNITEDYHFTTLRAAVGGSLINEMYILKEIYRMFNAKKKIPSIRHKVESGIYQSGTLNTASFDFGTTWKVEKKENSKIKVEEKDSNLVFDFGNVLIKIKGKPSYEYI